MAPPPTPPHSRRLPAGRSHATVRRAWWSGSSATAAAPGGTAANANSSGSGSSHGRRGGAIPSARTAPALATASRSRTVPSASCGADDRSPRATTSTAGRPRTEAGAVVLATWMVTCSPAPSRTTARPGRSRGSRAAASTPTTSVESATSWTRNATRRFALARMASLTTPAGRCVASTRWMPRLRPRWATPTSEARNSGRSAASPANSSTITTRRGSGSGAGCAVRWPAMSVTPAARSTASRRRISASRLRSALVARWSSRSVTTPTTWGSAAHASKALPPL